MPDWLVPGLIGLVFGTAISGFNHYMLLQGIRKAEKLPGSEGKMAIAKRYGIRYITNILAMFLVYKNAPMLVGTAIGLTAVKNILFAKNLTSGVRKG